MDPANLDDKKRLFLLTFSKKLTVTEVCDLLNMNRSTPYKWKERDEEFKQKFEEIAEEKKRYFIDKAKMSLDTQLDKGDSRLIMFTLNCLDKDFRENRNIHEESNSTVTTYQIIRGGDDVGTSEEGDNLQTAPESEESN